MRLAAIALLPALLLANPLLAAPGSPPSDSSAHDALEHSPRHGEYVDVPYAGHAPIRTWVVYPERADKAGVVLVVHEIFGLTEWVRGVTDALAAEGFIAIAPDLLSGLGPNGGGTEATTSRDEAVRLVRTLTPEETAARLAAVQAWARQVPATNGKWATLGFCWGGGRSFAAAAARPAPQASVVFYGPAPDSAQLRLVSAPVLAHYGGDDARITATVDGTRAALAALGRAYTAQVYAGAGHGFMRQQDGREGANLRAAQAAWPSTIAFLRKALR